MIPTEVSCLIWTVLIGLVLFFWGLSSRRFGAGTDTTLHPMRGRTSILFALALAVLAGLALCAYAIYKMGIGI